MELTDRLQGAIWGHLVGDALGVPYEFKTASQIATVEWRGHGTHHKPAGTWSDDGSLMLATLDSLLRARPAASLQFDTTDQAGRFLKWADSGAYTPGGEGKFDIGTATGAAFSRLRAGMPAEDAGGTGERAQGNGSLMRILPVALIGRELADAELVDQVHRSSAITHAHPVPQAICALYALIARNLLVGMARGEAIRHARHALGSVYDARSDAEQWRAALATIDAWTGRSGRGYVVDSFWSAWDSLAGAHSYRETVERAVRYGGDTDTTACIAGGLAGIRWGVSGIPAEWLAGLRGKDLVQPMVAALVGQDAPAEGVATSATQGAATEGAALAATQAPPSAGLPTLQKAPAPPGSRTSASHPIRVDWVDLRDVPRLARATGRLGMTFLPGKHDVGSAGRHWRDLVMDAARLRDEFKVGSLILLVEDHELADLGVPEIAEVMHGHGIAVLRYPIVDQGVPEDTSRLRRILEDVVGWVECGDRVVVACRGGLGRTGTFVALVLRGLGLDASTAIAKTRAARHSTIENATQEDFVGAWVPRSGGSRHPEPDAKPWIPG